MALNNKGQQNNTNQVFIDETQMSYNSKQSGKSIVEVRPQKSITFNPIDQGFNSEQQQFQAKSIEKDDQNYPSKQQKISSNEKQKNQTNILPSVRQNNLLLSPHSEEINQLLSRQNLVFSSNNNSFQNSIYYGSSNNQKSDMEQQQADFSSSGKNTIPKARVDMKELNNMLENQNFQKSQFNLPPQNQRANDKGKATNNQQLPQAICLLDKQYQNEAKNGSKNFKNGQILNQNQNQNQTKISIDFTQFQELQNSQINGQTTTQNYFHSIIPDPNQPTTNSRKKINDVNSNIHPNTQKGLDFQDIDINSKTDLRSPKSELHQTIHFENSSNGKRPSLDGKTNLNQFSKQRESSNNQKLREMDQTNLPFSDEISMHLHKLLKSQNELITQEILKITTILVASLIIEVLQIIRRFQYNEYLLFITLAFTCLGLEIISTASILAYLRTFNLQIIQQNHLKKIVFFLLVQLFRCIVFTNNFLKFDQENSALEVVIELFFIQLIIRQVLPNFKIFRMKDKLILIDMIVYALAGILCLNYEYDHIYNQIVQWGILILSFLIIQFKFNYFPFHLTICNKINVYDPQNNNYLLRKRSYFSQKVIESCYTDQLYMIKSNIKNPNLKSGNDTINNLDHKINYSVKQTQNQTWNQQQKEPQQQNNTQVFELSSRQEAENMLKDSVQYALLDDKAQSMYVSKQVIPQMMTIFAKKDKVNIFAETLPAELGHASPSDFTTIPRQKSQQNLNQINLIRLFDSFLENIIIERVDIDTMSMWENFKKQNQVKNLQGQQIQDSTSQYFSKKQIFNQDNQYLCQPFNSKQLQISQENPLPLSPAPSTFKDIIHARNLNLSQNKVSSSAITTTYNIAYSYKIGLKSQNIMQKIHFFFNIPYLFLLD